MRKCPNCNRPTARTIDWACQWCGYPLLSGGYKKVDKTYEQLKKERLELEVVEKKVADVSQPVAGSTLEAVPREKLEHEVKPMVQSEPVATESKALAELESELVSKLQERLMLRLDKMEPTPETVSGAQSEPVTEVKSEIDSKPLPESEPLPSEEVKSTPEPVTESEPGATQMQSESVLEPEPLPPTLSGLNPIVALESGQPVAALEVSVGELLSAYEADAGAAEARFGNKTLKVKGTVNRIEIKEKSDIYYINLTNGGNTLLQNVRCIFNKERVSELNELTIGQTVTVQGKYSGSIIDIRLKDCFIVR